MTSEDDEPPDLSGPNILRAVVARLPAEPLTISGDLTVRKRRGVLLRTLKFDMHLDWAAQPSTARYTILDALGGELEQLTVTRREGGIPDFSFASGRPLAPAALPNLFQAIRGTDLTWMDLTLSFLWWEGAARVGEEEIRGRPCYVLRVPAPEHAGGPPEGRGGAGTAYTAVRLWVDRQLFMLLQAEGYGTGGEPLRRLWVKSFKKINDRWMIKDMEVEGVPAVHRTKLRIREVGSDRAP
jgi:hypothetical protein